jgi:hypothetical protein
MHKSIDQRTSKRKQKDNIKEQRKYVMHSNDIARTRILTDDEKKRSGRKRKEILSKSADAIYISYGFYQDIIS